MFHVCFACTLHRIDYQAKMNNQAKGNSNASTSTSSNSEKSTAKQKFVEDNGRTTHIPQQIVSWLTLFEAIIFFCECASLCALLHSFLNVVFIFAIQYNVNECDITFVFIHSLIHSCRFISFCFLLFGGDFVSRFVSRFVYIGWCIAKCKRIKCSYYINTHIVDNDYAPTERFTDQ